MNSLNKWQELIGTPLNYEFSKTFEFVEKYPCDGYDCEFYLQSNGIRPDGEITFQRVMIAVPHGAKGKLPAVVVPFYYPEAALGYDPKTGKELPNYIDNPVIHKFVKRGFVVISGEAYHLTYAPYEIDKSKTGTVDFDHWLYIGTTFNKEHPEWSGIGKLVADTKLLIDAICNDDRVDSSRIAVAGHSLGGKMAFYTGCLDERIKVIMASDFGLLWHQTNWSDPWYWGDKLCAVKEAGLDNSTLLNCVAPKPFCLIAGEADDDHSKKMLYDLSGYKDCPEKLLVVDHRSGHRPPAYALDAGIGFIDYYLNKKD